ncbi:helix-turn-helix domain-containing protein [Streptomyces sp. 4N509B]|uniref:helix-turn-helix domain-containing protein n=1 Tax=Streptomyces sp. 4N509B TaxID=3457413 RepID=UPI003FCF3A3A
MRIHFSAADIARVRLAEGASQLAATTLSALRLAFPGPARPGSWRRATGAHVRAHGPCLFTAAACTANGPVPGFLLRGHPGEATWEGEVERLRATPRATLRADLEHVAGQRALPRSLRAVADGDRDALDALARAVHVYHRSAIAPYWAGIAAHLDADLAHRARVVARGGAEELLNTLHPRMRFRPPVLEIAGEDSLEYRLDGRGLLLVPAPFTSYVPCDPAEAQPTLHYQVPHLPSVTTRSPGQGQAQGQGQGHGPAPSDGFAALAALLGHGRASVLTATSTATAAAGEGLNTSRLAERTGLSPATVSEHTAILRRAGLLATHQAGRSRRHTLTPLGRRLLDATATGAIDDLYVT